MPHAHRLALAVAAIASTALSAGCSAPRVLDGLSETSGEPPIAPMATAASWTQTVSQTPGGILTLADGRTPVTATIDLATATQAVAGRDYAVLSDIAPRTTRWWLVPLALRTDGQLIAAQVPANQYDGGQWLLEPTVVGVLDGDSFTPWPSSETAFDDTHPRQAIDAAVDGTSTAWVETASTQMGISSWRIFTDDHGTPRLLARSEDVHAGDLPVRGVDTQVLVRDGRVYWNTPVPLDTAGTSFGVQVMSRAYDGSDAIRVEAAGASQPAISDGGLYVARSHLDDSTIPDGTLVIGHVTDDARVEDVLRFVGPTRSGVSSLVADGSRLAFALSTPDDSPGAVVILDTATLQVTTIPLRGPGRAATVQLCGPRLFWTTANGSIDVPDSASIGVLDLDTGDLTRIVDEDNYGGVQCADDLVTWRTLTPAPDARAVPTVVRWTGR